MCGKTRLLSDASAAGADPIVPGFDQALQANPQGKRQADRQKWVSQVEMAIKFLIRTDQASMALYHTK